MMTKKETLISIILKSINVVFVIAGVICSYYFGYTGGKECFLYFTTQSNLWVGVVEVILLVYMLIGLKKNKFDLPYPLHILYLTVTISIFLTGFTYCFILAPAALFKPLGMEIKKIMLIPAIILHVIVPVLTVVDFLLFSKTKQIKYINTCYTLIPPFYYLFFSMIGYYTNLDFGKGKNYPYFFLNFGSPAGYFGFSSEAPYFIGSFYWFIILFILVSLVSLLFIKIVNKRNKKFNLELKEKEK